MAPSKNAKVDWNARETWEKVVAAIIATDVKV